MKFPKQKHQFRIPVFTKTKIHSFAFCQPPGMKQGCIKRALTKNSPNKLILVNK